jgi:hypothetical protein
VAVGTAAVILQVAGVVAEAVVAAVVAVVAGAAWLLLRLRRRRGVPGDATGLAEEETPPTAGPDPVPRHTMELPVSLLATAQLAREWMGTTAALGGRPDPATWQAIARRRAEAPDELERRDRQDSPAGWPKGWPAAAILRTSCGDLGADAA